MLTVVFYYQPLKGGVQTAVYKCWTGEDEDSHAILVKVFTKLMRDGLGLKPEEVVACMRAAHAGASASEVLASFNNGVIYRFIPGEILTAAKYDSEEIRRYRDKSN